MATSVPAPIAMPTSARASAGASLTPSPTIATVKPRPCSSATAASLSLGRTSANTSSTPGRKPRSAATASATERASPVIMTILVTPPARSCSIVCRASGRTSSSSARAPITVGRLPSRRSRCRTAAPRFAQSSAGPARSAGTVTPSSRTSVGPPTAYGTLSTMARTPRPVSDVNPDACGGVASRAAAVATMARASGCSLSASTAPASRRTSCSVRPSVAAMAVTVWAPLVRVPVLSNRTVLTLRMRSRARRSLTRMPAFAATAVDNAITSGMASPNACGQAMTRTVMVWTTASSTLPTVHQSTKVTSAAAVAM